MFEVTKITPPTQQTLAQATPLIKQMLTSQADADRARPRSTSSAKKDWLSKTTCRAPYAMTDCNGYKAPKTRHAPAPTTTRDHRGELAPRVRRPTAEALARLDAITRRLRVECPWDREQDERTIVPHTVEEAYELADAAHRRDDAKLLDELGDVLFQVHFLSLLLEERGAGDLAPGGRRTAPRS